MKYYPCALNHRTGHITKQLTKTPMTRLEAEAYLKTHVPGPWMRAEAIPQPQTSFGEKEQP